MIKDKTNYLMITKEGSTTFICKFRDPWQGVCDFLRL